MNQAVLKTIHRIHVVGKCPLGCDDIYQIEFHIDSVVIPVERIQEVINQLTTDPIYQEDLTRKLCESLQCKVVSHGTHSRFVTECTAEWLS